METIQTTNPAVNDAVNSFDELILMVGLGLLVVVLVLGYRELRLRRIKRRETTTRLALGGYDLYNFNDCSRLEAAVEDLYRIYLTCCHELGAEALEGDEGKQQFIKLVAHPHIEGRLDLSVLPEQIKERFYHQYQDYLKDQAA